MNRHDPEDPGGVRVVAVRLAARPHLCTWNHADRTCRPEAGDRIVAAAGRSGLAGRNTRVVAED
ncbi:hypothetical protein ABT263_04310 [Kitasatospora sp. NPDC001603]|uniref:hypothetical protein n=1 Tax=Kitasatospora sp. NPDC001603 TaxID=3154388 RepID=UPI00332C4B33